MKKMTKVFGAVAASAALAMGCAMPALAAPAGEVSTETQNMVGNSDGELTGNSEVYLFGYDEATQIVATVPVSLTVAAPAAGGTIIPPTSGTYAITNGGTLGIEVTHIVGENEGNFTLSEAGTAPTAANTTNPVIWLNVANGATSQQIKPANGSYDGALTTSGNDFKAANDGDKITLDLSGVAFPKKSDTFGESAIPAVKVIYTIAAIA